jgi:acyl-CoA synthetase (AMP-forming)/AMP-acid ligase II
MQVRLNAALELKDVPKITLIGGGPDEDWNLSDRQREIAGLAHAMRCHFSPGERIAVLYQTDPTLLLVWFAALHAGLEPLILQYPNAKQNLSAWRSAIDQSFSAARLSGAVCSPELEQLGLEAHRPLFLSRAKISGEATAAVSPIPAQAAILQMSSGTTGHRKPIRLTLQQIAVHVRDYNETMCLGPGDCIVSWLPLYHDMGFIACFLMPLMLGIPVIMMDPMTWVRDPHRLFEAIDRYRGTTCYMPNFGFEVAAKHAAGWSLRTMRRWVSCSEPVQPATMARFAAATTTPYSHLSACYAMAENVFAVTQQDGLQIIDLNGRPVTSCGRPIANVQLKIVDGEIWVRSPTSLAAYADGIPITDPDGYYPSGDLGELIDEELIVVGRKHDLVNVAGKKFFLHELDQKLAQVLPTSDGRAVALARREQTLGTELPLFLIEDRDFYLRSDLPTIRAQLAPEVDLESFSLEFVPPGFLTKTSSGKINRSITLANYDTALHWRTSYREKLVMPSAEDELLRLFSAMPLDQPVAMLLDSLGLASLGVLLENAGLRLDPKMTLQYYLGSLRNQEHVSERRSGQGKAQDHIAIVSIADGRTISGITKEHLERLSLAVGAPVTLEHVCLPPTPVILSDLVFFDYFLAREWSDLYRPVVDALSKLRGASMLLVDDIAELLFGQFAYPVLNRRFERSPAADLLVWRWQKYTQHHDQLPISVVNLWQTQPFRNEFICRLGQYLGIPIFRIATLHSYAEHTAAWDFVERTNADWTTQLEVNTERLIASLASYLHENGDRLPRRTGRVNPLPMVQDAPHFCSMYIDRHKVESVLARFDRFCLVGPKSTGTFVRRRLRELGKPFFETSNLNLRGQGYSDDDFDCVLQVGSWGRVETSKPIFQLFSAGWDPTLQSTTIEGKPIVDPGWFHANPETIPNELSGKKSVLWLLGNRPAT